MSNLNLPILGDLLFFYSTVFSIDSRFPVLILCSNELSDPLVQIKIDCGFNVMAAFWQTQKCPLKISYNAHLPNRDNISSLSMFANSQKYHFHSKVKFRGFRLKSQQLISWGLGRLSSVQRWTKGNYLLF